MKKVALLSIVLILLAVAVVPVMAAGGNPNGHGNGVSAGQGNNGGNRAQEKQEDREQDRLQERDGSSNPGLGGNGNQGHTRMRTPFYLQGTISAIDPVTKTITVILIHGNAQVKQYIGGDFPLQATDTTLIFKITQGDENEAESGESATPALSSSESENSGETDSNRVAIPFDKLAVGQKVAIHGKLVDSIYTATLITAYIQMPVGESAGE